LRKLKVIVLLFQVVLSLLLVRPALALEARACLSSDWPLWQEFQRHFIQADGRVLDASTPQRHSSSEGQSYAMFFSLIANDRPTFEKLWLWAKNNLADGDIRKNLPGWIWGMDEQGGWRLLDINSASDADVWFAYVLLEAGRLWHDDRYDAEARLLLTNISTREVADLPGLGKMLLPGFQGFVRPDNLWQLNPSYLPIPVLRRLANAAPQGPWDEIANNTATLMKGASRHGFAPDWVAYQGATAGSGSFVVDPIKGDLGSYDAIRTYLWAGMTPAGDPLAGHMLQALKGMVSATRGNGIPPEKVQTMTGQTSGAGPFGFSAALLPYFKALGENRLLQYQQLRVQKGLEESLTPEALTVSQPPYYYFVLSLFSLGFMDDRYRFLEDGKLQLKWEKAC